MSKLVSLGLLCIGFLSPGACFAGINDDVLAVVRKLLAEGQPWVQVTHRLHRVTFYSACGNSVASANLPDSERPDPILELLVSKNPFGREGRELLLNAGIDPNPMMPFLAIFSKKEQVEVLRVFVDYKVDELEKRSAYALGYVNPHAVSALDFLLSQDVDFHAAIARERTGLEAGEVRP